MGRGDVQSQAIGLELAAVVHVVNLLDEDVESLVIIQLFEQTPRRRVGHTFAAAPEA